MYQAKSMYGITIRVYFQKTTSNNQLNEVKQFTDIKKDMF